MFCRCWTVQADGWPLSQGAANWKPSGAALLQNKSYMKTSAELHFPFEDLLMGQVCTAWGCAGWWPCLNSRLGTDARSSWPSIVAMLGILESSCCRDEATQLSPELVWRFSSCGLSSPLKHGLLNVALRLDVAKQILSCVAFGVRR